MRAALLLLVCRSTFNFLENNINHDYERLILPLGAENNFMQIFHNPHTRTCARGNLKMLIGHDPMKKKTEKNNHCVYFDVRQRVTDQFSLLVLFYLCQLLIAVYQLRLLKLAVIEISNYQDKMKAALDRLRSMTSAKTLTRRT